jgi:hypothetical protein
MGVNPVVAMPANGQPRFHFQKVSVQSLRPMMNVLTFPGAA